MKIHHLDCGCMCPFLGKIFPSILPKKFCCHVFLVETGNKLILVDTGLGTQDCANPSRVGPTRFLFNFQLRREESAVEQVKKLGLNPEDVTDIILTHLDCDHASGICDFPKATVHVSSLEMSTAKKQEFHHRWRYRTHYLKEHGRWKLIESSNGGLWHGLEGVQEFQPAPEILLVALPGHTPGHTGVAIPQGDQWLLHAGDAYYCQSLIDEKKNRYGFMNFFERAAHLNLSQAKETVKRLQELPKNFTVLCSHDNSFFSSQTQKN